MAATARADDKESTADSLFREARGLVAAGDYSAACPRFEESDRLDPAPGTRLNLADCTEHLGHLVVALERFEEVLKMLPPDDDRAAVATKRIAELKRRIPKLSVAVRGTPETVAVLRDGVDLGSQSWGVALRVDPGHHVVVVRSPRHSDGIFAVDLVEGTERTLEVSPGSEMPAAETRPPSSITSRSAVRSGPPLGAWLAWSAGGAGLVVGTVTGILALHDASIVHGDCSNGGCKPATKGADDDARSGAMTNSVVSTVGFAVAAAGATLGTLLWLVDRPRDARQASVAVVPSVGPQWGGLMLDGHFE
jgi:hypothetical protein